MHKLGLLFLLYSMMIPHLAEASREPLNAPRLNLGFSLGRYLVDGEDFTEAEGGTGIRSYIGVGVGSSTGFDMNLGFHFSRHGLETPQYHVDSYSVYAEPRVVFLRQTDWISPFVGARLGWAHAQGGNERTDYSISSDGFAVGGMGGISFPIAGVIRGELTVSITHLSFKPVSFIRGSGDRVDGRTLGFQLGVTLPIIVGGD